MKLKEAVSDRTVEQLRDDFQTKGYCLARGLYSETEVEVLNKHFEGLHADGGVPGFYTRAMEPDESGDILKMYPRFIHPHRFSGMARDYMTDERLRVILCAVMEEEPIAAQSMYYFKPPGARGQSLHQDNLYLKVKPGTCVAAWTALDFCDKENGGMMVVPGTHTSEINCIHEKNIGSYEGGPSIPVPEGMRLELPEMFPGDTLFFNGSLIHGSGPNRTKDRWRRSFICHYVGKNCESTADFYHPLVDFKGKDVERAATTDGGPCG